jgi:hypothetical protein
MLELCNKNQSSKHNEQINSQNMGTCKMRNEIETKRNKLFFKYNLENNELFYYPFLRLNDTFSIFFV